MPRRRSWLLLPAALAAVGVVVAVWLAPGSTSSSDRDDGAPTRSGDPGLALETMPDLHPPEVVIDHPAAAPDGRLILLSPRAGSELKDAGHQHGPLIVDQRGRIVWFDPPAGRQPVTDFRVQRYRGEPVLTWWEGAIPSRGFGSGRGVIADTSYRTVATVRAGHGLDMDLHEFILTPRGTAYITIYARDRADLSAIGGEENALVTQGIVQEVDVATGDVLFEWRSLDHVAPAESYREPPDSAEQSFDYFHINSIEEDSEGDLLVSARHTSALYKIDRETGEVVWRLGGKRSDFELGPGTEFGAQHDARYEGGDDVVRILDNAADDEDGEQTPSSVLWLALDTDAMRATLVRRLEHPDGRWAESQANAQRLPGGGLFVGWGSLGSFSRFDAEGRLLLAGHLPEGYDSYRGYLERWPGMPRTRPEVAARGAEGGGVTAFASWNGATLVRSWRLLAGPRPDRLRPAGPPVPWAGLETRLDAPSEAGYVAVRALDGAGRGLATSRPVPVSG